MKVYHEFEYDLTYQQLGDVSDQRNSSPTKEGIDALMKLINLTDKPIVTYRLYEKEMIYITSDPVLIEEVK